MAAGFLLDRHRKSLYNDTETIMKGVSPMKRIISLILVLVLCVGLLPMVTAASAPVSSSNRNNHWYINAERFYHPIYSNLAYENGQYVRTECIAGNLVVEYYDQNFKYLSGKSIPLELPIFGGVRLDSDYNFLVVGQENFEENDNKEVFRIIRYTKDWNKIDHASICGANTTIPFDAGSLRFDRSGDILYIRTAHEMYTTEDGLNLTTNFINSGTEFNCIFANNDQIAQGCYQACQEAGLDIPIVSTGGSPDAYAFLEDEIEAANMTAPVSIQGIQTFKNLYDYVTEGIVPEAKFQSLPVIPVAGDDLSAWIDWSDYAGAYEYVYGG